MNAHLYFHSLVAVVLGSACGSSADKPHGPEGRVTINASALTLTSLVDADYAVAVFNRDGDRVWSEDHVTSTQFGDRRGAIAYVGTCDASSSPNRVELTVNSLTDDTHVLRADEWANPTADGPLVQHVDCVENADTAVDFNVTVMRRAVQGFFDIGVEFSDIFCSAKVDCKASFLHDPTTEERGATVIVALACTSGGDNEPTWLHYDDVFVRCDDGVHRIMPSYGPGNGPGSPDAVFATGHYRGQEQLPGYDKCYWNLAIGLTLGQSATNCSLEGFATASNASFMGDGMSSPPNTVYPYIGFALPLTDEDGAFTCSSHPLDGTPGGVSTGYTDLTGRDFKHEWECGPDTDVTTQKRECEGALVGQNGAAAGFVQSPGGVRFELGDAFGPTYQLDPGLRIGGCCANPCPNCRAQ